MSKRYSVAALARHAVSGAPWPRAWRASEPKPSYDIVIIGGGGHGLATAYYLAANHGITNVAVIERAYVGAGNVGRNTTLIRSNYVLDGNMGCTRFSGQVGVCGLPIISFRIFILLLSALPYKRGLLAGCGQKPVKDDSSINACAHDVARTLWARDSQCHCACGGCCTNPRSTRKSLCARPLAF